MNEIIVTADVKNVYISINIVVVIENSNNNYYVIIYCCAGSVWRQAAGPRS